MKEWIKKSDVLKMLDLPPDILVEHIRELKGVLVDEDWLNAISERQSASRKYAQATGKCPMCEDCPNNCPLDG